MAIAWDERKPPELDLIKDCVHCGFCLPTCPSYLALENENDSPRGRIVLMRIGHEEGSEVSREMTTHLDRCLGCMACVTACPSGVQYDRLIERARPQVERHGARTRRDSPDALVQAVADSAMWTGHPYALEPLGTVESLSRISVASLRRYQREQMVKSRMLLVVVGNVERAQVERMVHATIGTLPAGSYQWTLPRTPPVTASTLTVVSRPLPTNYVLGYYAGPPASSADYPALRVATAVLGGRLFAEIRSRRNLTYAVDAPFIEHAASSGGLYVTTTQPETTLGLMQVEVQRLKDEMIDPSGLERLVQQFITEYFLNNETNAAQADFIARGVLYRGSALAATPDRFVDDLRAVRPQDVQRVARTYMRGIHFAYVGDPTAAPRRAAARFQ